LAESQFDATEQLALMTRAQSSIANVEEFLRITRSGKLANSAGHWGSQRAFLLACRPG